MRSSYLPVIRARIALNQNDASKAIEILQVAVPYELGASRELIGALYPVYESGEAHLAARQRIGTRVGFFELVSDALESLAQRCVGSALIQLM